MQAYASVQLNATLGYNDAEYGLGSGIFFAGYMIFQVCRMLHIRGGQFGQAMWTS